MSERLQIAYPEGGWYRIDAVLLYAEDGNHIRDDQRIRYALDDYSEQMGRAVANIILWLDSNYKIVQIQTYPSGTAKEDFENYGFATRMLARYMPKGGWTRLPSDEDYWTYEIEDTIHERLVHLAELASIAAGHAKPTPKYWLRSLRDSVERMLPPRLLPAARAVLDEFQRGIDAAKEAEETAAAEAELAAAAAAEEARGTSHVYVLQHGDDPLYKIGVAKNPAQRAKELSTGAPRELKIVASKRFADARAVERALHRVFRRDRARGEWFELSDTAVAELVARLEQVGADARLKQPDLFEVAA
jgi:hypothetical protein